MGEARRRRLSGDIPDAPYFGGGFVEDCEKNHMAAVSIAISRLTGWPILALVNGKALLRCAAVTSSGELYDALGSFDRKTMYRRVAKAFPRRPKLSIEELFMDPDELIEMTSIDMSLVDRVLGEVAANARFRAILEQRPFPRYPAIELREFSGGFCVAFAYALAERTGAQVAELVGEGPDLWQFDDNGEKSKRYFHMVVQHSDTEVEDVWGRASPEEVATRNELVSYSLRNVKPEDGWREWPSAKSAFAAIERAMAAQVPSN